MTGVFNAFGTEDGNYSYFPNHQQHIVTFSQHYYMSSFPGLTLSMERLESSAKSKDYMLRRPEADHICVLMVEREAEAIIVSLVDMAY